MSDADNTTKSRGFASMDTAKQREIASRGGKAAHAQGRAHEFTADEARGHIRRTEVSVAKVRCERLTIGDHRNGLSRRQRATGYLQAGFAVLRGTAAELAENRHHAADLFKRRRFRGHSGATAAEGAASAAR